MSKYLLALIAVFASASVFAAKSCDELKGEIETKIKDKGVQNYSLEILAKDAESDGKVVGTCEGGAKKIVYKRSK